MINNQYPTLAQLFSCYFHQDWVDEFDSPEMAIDSFADSEPYELVNTAVKELEKIIIANPSESEILNLLNELGCYYDPNIDGVTALNWLEAIKDALESKE